MKNEEKMKELLEELKGLLNDDTNQESLNKHRKEIKDKYLDEETSALVFINDVRTIMCGRNVNVLTLLATFISHLKDKDDFDLLFHTIVGGLALDEEGKIDKEIIKIMREQLKRYL